MTKQEHHIGAKMSGFLSVGQMVDLNLQG